MIFMGDGGPARASDLVVSDEDGAVIERKCRPCLSPERAKLPHELSGTKPVPLRLHSDYSKKYPVVDLTSRYAL
jgi:hypothetical protein